MADDRFLDCLSFTLAEECPYPNDWSNPKNFSDDAHDPGGETMCGIIQREYDSYRKSTGLPVQDVRNITQEEGQTIYRNSYWLPHCPDLPAGLDLCFFDSSVNEGSAEATRILQVTLHIPSDGMWGPQTTAAVAAISNVSAVIGAFTVRRETVYREMRGFKYFGRDWLARSVRIEKAAVGMVG